MIFSHSTDTSSYIVMSFYLITRAIPPEIQFGTCSIKYPKCHKAIYDKYRLKRKMQRVYEQGKI